MSQLQDSGLEERVVRFRSWHIKREKHSPSPRFSYRSHKSKVDLALSEYEKGKSYRQVARFLGEHGVKVTPQTIMRWMHQLGKARILIRKPKQIKLSKLSDEEKLLSKFSRLACHNCGNHYRVVKHGFRIRLDGFKVQRYKCPVCQESFVIDPDHYPHFRFNKAIINYAIKRYDAGDTCRLISRRLQRRGLNIQHVTVNHWIQKFWKPKLPYKSPNPDSLKGKFCRDCYKRLRDSSSTRCQRCNTRYQEVQKRIKRAMRLWF